MNPERGATSASGESIGGTVDPGTAWDERAPRAPGTGQAAASCAAPDRARSVGATSTRATIVSTR